MGECSVNAFLSRDLPSLSACMNSDCAKVCVCQQGVGVKEVEEYSIWTRHAGKFSMNCVLSMLDSYRSC